MVDPRNKRLLAYNESAGFIWNAIARGASVDAAAALVAQEYRISFSQAASDVDAIVGHWRQLDLLGDAATPSPAVATTQARACPKGPVREVAYAIAGRTFRTVIADERISHSIESVLAPYHCDERCADTVISVESADCGEWVVCLNHIERVRSRQPAEIIGSLYQIMLEALHRRSDWLAIMHAAAVVKNGNAYILAGPSGSGKSTLAAALSASGFRYAADDMAALFAPAGHLAPWPLPQSVKPGSWRALAAAYPRLDEAPVVQLGGKRAKFLVAPNSAWCEVPRPIGALIFPQFNSLAPPEAVRLRPLEALQRLLLDRIWLGDVASFENVERFLRWLEATPAVAIRYQDVSQAHGFIDQLV